MKKFIHVAFASAAALVLASCGSSDTATEQATPDNVEMPAEEPLNTVAAMPSPDMEPTAAATDPNAGAAPEDAAAAAAAAAQDFDAAADPGAEQAIEQAEKNM
ncbi:MAG: hypothetical protein V4579_09700 [Pseudomonadota bacterium]